MHQKVPRGRPETEFWAETGLRKLQGPGEQGTVAGVFWLWEECVGLI